MSRAILEVNSVNFAYPSQVILDSVSFELFEHDFVAVIGPNGGGKSTLIKILMGLLMPNSGTVSLFGEAPKIGRKKVGYLPQFNVIDLEFPITVEEVVLMSRLRNPFFSRITSQDREDLEKVLDRVGISHLISRSISALSGGEKQRVFLARALLNQPQLLILDEPTTSVDAQAERGIYELLSQLRQDMTILMVSHDLTAVSQLVNRIACLNRKLIIHQGKELAPQDLEEIYGCPVALIAHGVPHHHLHSHD